MAGGSQGEIIPSTSVTRFSAHFRRQGRSSRAVPRVLRAQAIAAAHTGSNPSDRHRDSGPKRLKPAAGAFPSAVLLPAHGSFARIADDCPRWARARIEVPATLL